MLLIKTYYNIHGLECEVIRNLYICLKFEISKKDILLF